LKTIIAGGRKIENFRLLRMAIRDCQWRITSVLCGCCSGVDLMGAEWANKRKIHVDYYPAEWGKYGKSAGIIRNKKMAENADALILIRSKSSKGSSSMLKEANALGLKVFDVVTD